LHIVRTEKWGWKLIRRFYHAIALFVALGSSGLWALEVRTTINAIAHEGNYQTLGIFTLVIDGNDFPNASPESPVYIRFRTLQSNGWSNSLVDLRPDAPDEVNQPINLAILPPTSGTDLNPVLPADTIQIVRLIKGETEGWLRVQYPTSNWIQGGSPPSADNFVSVTVGIGGFDSVQAGTNTHSGGNEHAISRFPAGTVLRADYRNTPFFGNGDLEYLDFVGYGSQTQGVEDGDNIFPGSILGFGFSNDLAVARGTFNFPCLDYHFAPENFEAGPHRVSISRINLVNFRQYEFDIPSVYLTNTSDFPWQVGTNLFLNYPGFSPDLELAGIANPGGPDPEDFPVTLSEDDIKVVPQGGSEWEVTTLYWGGKIAGYRMVLTNGTFGINDSLTLSGLRGSTDENFAGTGLTMEAKAFYRHEQITFGELKPLGSIKRKTVTLEASEPTLSRKVIPYTCYDQTNWKFNLHLLNPNEHKIAYTALFYNRHGILLRILGNQSLEGASKRIINIGDLFGLEAEGILSWVEILSEEPFQALGEIRDDQAGLLDIFPANDQLQKTLYGIHLPSEINRWRTNAYVVSADLASDTEFNMTFPNTDPFRVNSIFLPGGTAILGDGQFISEGGRQPWFQVETSTEGGAGLLLYSRHGDSPQLVSVLMNNKPAKQWQYDHLGNPESQWWNGLVMFNPNEESINITLQGLDDKGMVLGSTSVTVPALSKLVALVSQWLAGLPQPPAMLNLTSVDNYLSLLLIGREDRSILTSVTGNIPDATEFKIAYLPKNTDEWLGLAVFNKQAAEQTVTLTMVDFDGQDGPMHSMVLPARQKVVLELRDIFGDLTAFSHLNIEAQAPVRAFGITGNDAGTQLATVVPLSVTQ